MQLPLGRASPGSYLRRRPEGQHMATFTTLNTTAEPMLSNRSSDEQTPTTPRPIATPTSQPAEDGTNTQDTLPASVEEAHGGVQGQQALPEADLTQAQTTRPESPVKRDEPLGVENVDPTSEQQDVEMGEGDDVEGGEDEASDNESVTSDSQRPSKKKKGQRFFCTAFPPCTLSFTRSEHLARHIRKHTGERPFICHCSRRFSRLDNLRQHAQTVHVNEEIPTDSLAATSTRFQRQIRTDRVRPAGNRSRTNTLGSNGGHSRGHSRNLSASSVGSTTSSVGIGEETRRRPQPLAMAADPSSRARLSIDTYSNVPTSPSQQYAYYNQSPTGFSTPTSTTFSMGNESPRFGSSMASPASTLSRSSFYNGSRHSRRLSVPSTQVAYPQMGGNTYPPPMYFSPIPSATSSNFAQGGSVFASPTGSVFSQGRRDSEAELDYRRRTWHSGSYGAYPKRPATSGLSYQQTPDDQRSAPSSQPAASQVTRLPGIESFDHAPPTNARQPTSPMVLSSSPRPPSSGRPCDAGLHQNLTRLDITSANNNTSAEGHWQAMQQQVAPQQIFTQQQAGAAGPQQYSHQHTVSMPEPVTPRKNKRQAWYGGPVAPPNTFVAHRTSPEDSGSSDGVPTPGTSHGPECHPVIVHANGVAEQYSHPMEEPKSYDQPPQMYTFQSNQDPRSGSGYQPSSQGGMTGLEALAAVAYSESAADRS